MAAASFKDIIQRQQEYLEAEERKKITETISSAELKKLMAEAVKMGGDVNENVIKLYDEMRKQTNILQKEQKNDLAVAEEKQEAAKVDQDQTDLLEQIADNTKEKPGKESKELGLGTIVATLTAALAGLAGAVAGYVKSIKVLLDVFTPDFIKTKLANTIANFEKTLVEFGSKLRNVFTKGVDKITAFLTEGFSKLKSLFTFDEASKISKMITGFKEGFSKLLAPFTEAFTTIKNLISGTTKGLEFVGGVAKSISSTIGSIGKTLGSIASLFKGVFGVVSKLATPLFVIMTLWDTVSNVIDRFESDGVIGAFAGVFEGLFKSIVAAPLDLLKDIVSWVLGKFGFDEAEKFLDSFSIVDIVTGFFDAILNPIDTIASMFEGVVGLLESFEIPKIGFTIPIIDKEVSIGPFYPFRKEKPAEAEVGAGKTAAAEASAPQKGSREEYDAAYKKNLEKTGGNQRVAQKLTAQEVGLAPGAHPDTLPSGTTAVVSAKGAGVSQDMAVTGATINGEVAPTSRQEYYKQQGFTPDQIANLNTRQAKIDALRSQDPNAKIDKDLAIVDSKASVTKEQYTKTYQKYLSEGRAPFAAKMLADKEHGLFGSGLSASALPSAENSNAAAVTPVVSASSAANMVYGASAENAAVASMPQQTSSTNNTVVAPTTVNNNTVNSYKPDVRNQDSSFRRMLDQRYVRV